VFKKVASLGGVEFGVVMASRGKGSTTVQQDLRALDKPLPSDG